MIPVTSTASEVCLFCLSSGFEMSAWESYRLDLSRLPPVSEVRDLSHNGHANLTSGEGVSSISTYCTRRLGKADLDGAALVNLYLAFGDGEKCATTGGNGWNKSPYMSRSRTMM